MLIHTLAALASPGLPGNAESLALDVDQEMPDRTQIINGEGATRDDFPMTGGLLMTASVDFFGLVLDQTALMCSSTLIAPDVVLLAAHCVDVDPLVAQLDPTGQAQLDNVNFYWSRNPDLSRYQLGGQASDLPADAVRATEAVFHPDWSFDELQTGLARNSDIALLFLEEPITDVEPAYLPRGLENELQLGDDVIVVGWGQQVANQPGQQPPPGTVGFKQQGNSEVAEVGKFEFKVGEVVTDVRKCHGDSGGPSFVRASDGSMRLVGVTSHAYDFTDCLVTGGVDTRVSAFYGWIDNEMRRRCADGSRAWCEEDWGVLASDERKEFLASEGGVKARACNAAPGPWPLAALFLLPLLRRREHR